MSEKKPPRFTAEGRQIRDAERNLRTTAMTERGARTLVRELNAGRIEPDQLAWREPRR